MLELLNQLLNSFLEVAQQPGFLYLTLACFAGAFIDAVAGGGGLISLPAFMGVFIGAGLPVKAALGTNKGAASFGAFSSFMKFYRAGKVEMNLIKKIAIYTVIGAIIGVRVQSLIDDKYLIPIFFVFIVILIGYSLYNKRMGFVNEFEAVTRESLMKGSIMALSLGFYDGFFGPGAGSFLIFAFIKIFKFDFIHASGNAKALNFVSNIVSLAMFIYLGKVEYAYAIPMALVMFLGAQLGAHFAIAKGSKFIKVIFVVMSVGASLKMLYKYFYPN